MSILTQNDGDVNITVTISGSPRGVLITVESPPDGPSYNWAPTAEQLLTLKTMAESGQHEVRLIATPVAAGWEMVISASQLREAVKPECAVEGCHEEPIEGHAHCFAHIAEELGECHCVLPDQSCPTCRTLAAILDDKGGRIFSDPVDRAWWGDNLGEVCQ